MKQLRLRNGQSMIALTIFFYFAFLLIGHFIAILSQNESSFLHTLLTFILSAVIAYGCYHFLGKDTQIFDSRLPLHKTSRFLLTALSLYFLFFMVAVLGLFSNLVTIFSGGPALILSSLLAAFGAGLFEELLVRGLAFKGFSLITKNSILFPAVASSLLFGLLHLANLSTTSFGATLQQVFYATILGLFFSVVRLAANNLRLVIALHTLIDLQPTIQSSSGPALQSWASLLVVFIPLAFLSILTLFHFSSILKNN